MDLVPIHPLVQSPASALDLCRDQHHRRSARRIIRPEVQYHPRRPGVYLRRKLVRHSRFYRRLEPRRNFGAVQTLVGLLLILQRTAALTDEPSHDIEV